MKTVEFHATENSVNKRLDVSIALELSISRQHARRLIEAGSVRINGARKRIASYQLYMRDMVTVTMSERTPEPRFQFNSDYILFQNNDVFICNKPPGIASQAYDGSNQIDFYAAVTAYLKKNKLTQQAPALLHRLDRGVSGCMIFPLTKRARMLLHEQFATHTLYKAYVAITRTPPQNERGIIETRLSDSFINGKIQTLQSGGKNAITEYRLIKSLPDASVILFIPLTGRTHQIRVHAAFLGSPIIGDSCYGSESEYRFPLLHCWRMKVQLPEMEPLLVQAPFFEPMSQFMNAETLQALTESAEKR